jgi:hypothetical protein
LVTRTVTSVKDFTNNMRHQGTQDTYPSCPAFKVILWDLMASKETSDEVARASQSLSV